MIQSFALCCVLSVIAIWPAAAQTPITYVEEGRALFTVDMPDFWLARSGGAREFSDPDRGEPLTISRVLSLEPETARTAWVGMIAPDGVATLDAAEVYVTNLGRFLVEDPARTGGFERRVGGLPARIINGTGRRDGENLRFSVILTELPGARTAVIVALAANDAPDGVIDEINRIVESFRSGGR